MIASTSDTRFVLVTGHQRSGTSVFRNALNSLPGFVDFGEVMTPGRAEARDTNSVFEFASTDAGGPLDRPYPAGERSWELLRRYFRHLRSNASAPIGLIDVKIDFLHNFDPVSHLPAERPLLLDFARKNDFAIVHFHRRRLLDQLLSLEIGHRVGQWHYTTRDEHDPAPPTPFELDTSDALRRLRAMHESSRLLVEWMRGHRGYMRVLYENVFRDPTRIAPAVVDRLQGNLGLDIPDDLVLPFRPSPFTPSDLVANLPQLEEAASNAGLLTSRLVDEG